MEYETLNQTNAAELLDVTNECDGGAIRGCMFAILFAFDWYMLILDLYHAWVLL